MKNWIGCTYQFLTNEGETWWKWGTTSWKTKTKNPIWRWTLGQKNHKPNFMTKTWMIEGSWDVARNQTNPTMCQTFDFARWMYEESGRKAEWLKIIWQYFCPNRPFLGKQSILSPVFAMLTYKCHTCLESCWKCRFIGVNCFRASFILRARGIFLTLDPDPDP